MTREPEVSLSTTAGELRGEAFASDGPRAGGVAAAGPAVTIIEQRPGWRVIDLGELWRYRELLGFLIWRDVKVRYKQTVLGIAWAVLQPLMMMVVFTIFFGRLAKVSSGDWPYPVFAYAGLLPWTFFATAITSAGNSVVGSEQLITKVYFPRLAIPFAAVGAAVVDFAIAFVLLGALMAAYGVAPGAGAWLAPLIFLLILLAALGIGTFLAALNVAFRDFKYVIPFLTQVWMFATPTVYMEPQDVSPLFLNLNPMTPLIAAFRATVLGRPIAAGPLALASAVILVLFLGGCSYFRRAEARFADII
jgi:lipopolysaccharide transport system permease protein